ncbi:MAG: Crp/Fnr family transcriptional regulator [Chloroflexi bacterium]|nr:Crp/Fnr family transcriptional regulator [Chloroflexota bacterium]
MPAVVDFLSSLPYFVSLNPQELENVRKAVIELAFDKGEVVLLQGEPCRGLYVVKSGQVRIYMSSPDGREQVLFVARPGDSFNDVPVFDGGPNPASGLTLEPTTIYLIPKEAILSLISSCPAALSIIKVLGARLRRLTSIVEDLSFRTVVSRLAKVLMELAVAGGGPAPVPRLTQDEIAARVGSVRDVVGRALRALEKAGAIRIEGQRIIVVDRSKLTRLL